MLGADGGAALPDTARLGGEAAGMGAGGGAALPDTARLGGGDGRGGSGVGAVLSDTACLGGETAGSGAALALPFWTRTAWAGRRLGWERQGLLEGREGDLSLGTAGEWTANAVKANSFI